MKKVQTFVCVSLLSLGTLAALPASAHAYLDPGSGSYALQVALAGVVGAAFGMKLLLHRLRRLVGGLLPGRRSAGPASRDGD